MRLEWFRSATVSITSPGGTSVLCDPWMTDGAFIGSWFHWTPLEGWEFDDLASRPWDLVYISHLHADHFDRALVAEIARRQPDAKAVIADFQHDWLRGAVERCGFSGDRLIVLPAGERRSFGDLELTILTADQCDPKVCGVSSPCLPGPAWLRSIDSLALFSSGGFRILHANDALAVATVPKVLPQVGRVDVLLGHYGGAGPFPQCFPGVEDKPTAARRMAEQFLRRLASAADLLGARYVMPFAGQYQLGGSLVGLNGDRSVVPLDEALEWLARHSAATPISLRPFEGIDFAKDVFGSPWEEPSAAELKAYLDRIAVKRLPYQRQDETWPDAARDLGRVLDRIARRYPGVPPSDAAFVPVSIELIADPGLASVASDGCDLPRISLALDFYRERVTGGVDAAPAFENVTRISTDPRLLRRLVQRAPDYGGFTPMHLNQAEIGSHLQWERVGPHVAHAHGMLNFVS